MRSWSNSVPLSPVLTPNQPDRTPVLSDSAARTACTPGWVERAGTIREESRPSRRSPLRPSLLGLDVPQRLRRPLPRPIRRLRLRLYCRPLDRSSPGLPWHRRPWPSGCSLRCRVQPSPVRHLCNAGWGIGSAWGRRRRHRRPRKDQRQASSQPEKRTGHDQPPVSSLRTRPRIMAGSA